MDFQLFRVYYVEINTFAIAILATLYVLIVRNMPHKQYRPYYQSLIIMLISLCISDMMACLLRGQTDELSIALLWLFNGLYYITGALIASIWALYSYKVLAKKKSNVIYYLIGIPTVAIVGLIATSPLTDIMFTISEDGIYSRGWGVYLHWTFMFSCEFIPLFLALVSKNKTREKQAIILFPIAPTIALIAQTLYYGITSAQVGLTLSALFLYVLVQNNKNQLDEQKTEAIVRVTLTDELTQLPNRRAYIDALNTMKTKDFVCAAFFDLNELKKTNDNWGHEAGDSLIKNFANFLRDYFVEQNIFRISGDEFVILYSNEVDFDVAIQRMRINLGTKAAYGTARGPGENINNIVNTAEKIMYEYKSQYYTENGIERRK